MCIRDSYLLDMPKALYERKIAQFLKLSIIGIAVYSITYVLSLTINVLDSRFHPVTTDLIATLGDGTKFYA